MFCLYLLEKLYCFKQNVTENYFSYDIDKRAKFR